MTRSYPYRITLLCYSGRRHVHYVKAHDRNDARDKAYRFANPITMSGHDGVQFMNVDRITHQYCIDNNITFE